MVCLQALRSWTPGPGLAFQSDMYTLQRKVAYKNIMWCENEKKKSILIYLPIALAKAERNLALILLQPNFSVQIFKMTSAGRKYIEKA